MAKKEQTTVKKKQTVVIKKVAGVEITVTEVVSVPVIVTRQKEKTRRPFFNRRG